MAKNWSGNNRAPWHDYTSRQIYHITLLKRPETMVFGRIAGDWQFKPGSYGAPYLQASPLGKIIKDCLREISTIHPALKIYQYALMPDHLHLILSVESFKPASHDFDLCSEGRLLIISLGLPPEYRPDPLPLPPDERPRKRNCNRSIFLEIEIFINPHEKI